MSNVGEYKRIWYLFRLKRLFLKRLKKLFRLMGNLFSSFSKSKEYIVPACISPFPYPPNKAGDEDTLWQILEQENIYCKGIKMHHKYAYALIRSSDLDRLKRVLGKYAIRGGQPLTAEIRLREGEVSSCDIVVCPLDINFCQPLVGQFFKHSDLALTDTLEEIGYQTQEQIAAQSRISCPASFDGLLKIPFPAIRVCKIDDMYYTVDNRRLWTMQKAALREWPCRVGCFVRELESIPSKHRGKIEFADGGKVVNLRWNDEDIIWSWRYEAGHISGWHVHQPVSLLLCVLMVIAAFGVMFTKTTYSPPIDGQQRLMLYVGVMLPFLIYTRVWPFYQLEDNAVFRHVSRLSKQREANQWPVTLAAVAWFLWVAVLCSVPYMIIFGAPIIAFRVALWFFIFLSAIIGCDEDASTVSVILSAAGSATVWTLVVHFFKEFRTIDSAEASATFMIWLRAVWHTWKSAFQLVPGQRGGFFLRLFRATAISLLRAVWPILIWAFLHILTPAGTFLMQVPIVNAIVGILEPYQASFAWFVTEYLSTFLEMMSQMHPDDQEPIADLHQTAPEDFAKAAKITEAEPMNLSSAHDEFVEAKFGDMKHASAEL